MYLNKLHLPMQNEGDGGRVGRRKRHRREEGRRRRGRERETSLGSCAFPSLYSFGPWRNFTYSSVQSLGRVQLFVTPWTAARQASLFIINSQSLLKLKSMELVMPSNHLILCRPLLLPLSVFPRIRVFSNESALHIRWPK